MPETRQTSCGVALPSSASAFFDRLKDAEVAAARAPLVFHRVVKYCRVAHLNRLLMVSAVNGRPSDRWMRPETAISVSRFSHLANCPVTLFSTTQ